MKSNKQPKVSIVKVTFYSLPDFVFSTDQWNESGGYRGLIKSGAFHIGELKKVIYGKFMNAHEFNSLGAWEG